MFHYIICIEVLLPGKTIDWDGVIDLVCQLHRGDWIHAGAFSLRVEQIAWYLSSQGEASVTLEALNYQWVANQEGERRIRECLNRLQQIQPHDEVEKWLIDHPHPQSFRPFD